jgi:ParB family chromosome partitioning protein
MAKKPSVEPAQLDRWDEAVLIPIEDLVPTYWNVNVMDEAEFATLIEEIKDGGFDEPCQVVPVQDGDNKGRYLILGGEHRYKASISLRSEKIPCVIKKHLTGADEETLMEWSVRRNHIRGRLDAQKYAELEKRITGRWKISAEAARNRMLVREQRAADRKNRFTQDVIETMVEMEKEKIGDGSGPAAPSEEVDLSGPSPDKRRPPKEVDEDSDTDGKKDRKKAFADRRALLSSLKAFHQDVLQQSADTIDQGYVYFGIGGITHLVVNETPALNKLIGELVEVCKANSDTINEFLISAIKKELPQWQ